MTRDPRLAPVEALFHQSLAEGGDLGAQFCVVRGEDVLLNLSGGFADRGRTRPFDERTLTPVFSVTKILAAVLIARLVDQGRLSYAEPMSGRWPAFAGAGKGEITVGQALSHQAGLSGFLDPMAPADWFDWQGVCARLEAMAPLWPPGAASGYHPVTFGYLAGELFRRVDGRTMGQALRQDLAGPLGLDLFIGLPEEEDVRVAELERPKALPRFGAMTPALKAAFLSPWSSPGGRGGTVWRRAEIPSANGHASALGLARLMALVLEDGPVLSAAGRQALTAERIYGQDLVLPFTLSWGAGVMRNGPLAVFGPDPAAFGHYGWGGACAMADPVRGVGMAYVMNRQSAELIGDPRARRLLDAACACLDS
jgi:CubicO group peptidase (beta-lactamase class C family)